MKRCTKCSIEKPFDAFYKTRGGNRRAQCIECTKIQEQLSRAKSDYQKQYQFIHRERKSKQKADKRATVHSRARELVGQARRRAADKGHAEFDVSLDLIVFILQVGVCQRSGVRFDLTKPVTTRKHKFAPSIDKIDPHKSYVAGNVQVVCDMYNRGKGQNTDDEFIAFCKTVAEQHK